MNETAIGIVLLVMVIAGGAFIVLSVRRNKPSDSHAVREANREAKEKAKQRAKLLERS